MDSSGTHQAPPLPLQKERNAVLRLYDAPLYRDWLFWWTAGWGVLAAYSVPVYAAPSQIPIWLETVFGVFFWVIVAGILPSKVRLLIRRWQWRRHHQDWGEPAERTTAYASSVAVSGSADPGAPPLPLAKRRNTVLRLYDSPLYRDWLFWWTVGWVVLAGAAMLTSLTSAPPNESTLAAIVVAFIIMTVVPGVAPAWLRLLIRRWRLRENQPGSSKPADPMTDHSPSPTITPSSIPTAKRPPSPWTDATLPLTPNTAARQPGNGPQDQAGPDRATEAWLAASLIVIQAITGALINELHGGWGWWIATGLLVLGWAAVTWWLVYRRADRSTRARNDQL